MSRSNGQGRRPTAVECKERETFQAFLDDHFPLGAMCATFVAGERLIGSSESLATGRLICTDAKEDDRGRWWYELIIDPRRRLDEDVDALILWVGKPRQRRDAPDLWESDVRSDPAAPLVLRLNAKPPERWRPTRRMWQVVSQTYNNV